jgi:hypothetical protein
VEDDPKVTVTPEVEIEAVIIRANGKRENLGVIASTKTAPPESSGDK